MNVLAKSVAGRSPRVDAAEHMTTVGPGTSLAKEHVVLLIRRGRRLGLSHECFAKSLAGRLPRVGAAEHVTTMGREHSLPDKKRMILDK